MLACLPQSPLPLITLAVGQSVDPADINTGLATLGCCARETVDEPDEVAWNDTTADLFPTASAHPVQLELYDMDGVTMISALHAFDPVTQRTTHPAPSVTLHRAVAGPLSTTETATAAIALARGADPDDLCNPAPLNADKHPDAFTLAPGEATCVEPDTRARQGRRCTAPWPTPTRRKLPPTMPTPRCRTRKGPPASPKPRYRPARYLRITTCLRHLRTRSGASRRTMDALRTSLGARPYKWQAHPEPTPRRKPQSPAEERPGG